MSYTISYSGPGGALATAAATAADALAKARAFLAQGRGVTVAKNGAVVPILKLEIDAIADRS